MNRTKIVLLIDNVHMGLGHEGLAALARKFNKNPDTLQDGDLLMFLNRAKDKLKVMGPGAKVLGYLKMPKGRKIAMEAIQYIPQTFGASGFNYEAALERHLEQKLARRGLERASPLAIYRATVGQGRTARTQSTMNTP